MEKLTQLEALLLTAVLENCVDQLAILGYIMPVSHEGKTDISHVRASVLFKKIPLVFLLVFYVSYQHSLNIHTGIFSAECSTTLQGRSNTSAQMISFNICTAAALRSVWQGALVTSDEVPRLCFKTSVVRCQVEEQGKINNTCLKSYISA